MPFPVERLASGRALPGLRAPTSRGCIGVRYIEETEGANYCERRPREAWNPLFQTEYFVSDALLQIIQTIDGRDRTK